MKKEIIIPLLAIAGLMFFFYFLFGLVRIGTDKGTKLKVLDTLPSEYTNVFISKDTSFKDKESWILYTTNINPFSDFTFERKYWIFITKLKTSNTKSTLPIITEKSGNATITQGHVYAGFKKGYFEVNFLADTSTVSNVSLTLDGDSIRPIVKNDSIVSFYLKMKALSIGYKNNYEKSICMNVTDSPISSIVIFIMHERSTYFISISAYNPIAKLDLDEVLKIINLKKIVFIPRYRKRPRLWSADR